MLKRDRGIVLVSKSRGETSKLLTFLGREAGKVRLIVKGGRKGPAPLAYEPGTLLEVIYYYKQGRDIYYLKEAFVLGAPWPSDRSLEESACLLAALDLIDQVSYPGMPEGKVVEVAEAFLCCSDASDPLLLFLLLAFKILGILGLMPDLSSCSLCHQPLRAGFYQPAAGTCYCRRHRPAKAKLIELDADLLALLRRTASEPLAQLASLHVSGERRKNFGRVVHETYTFHVQGYHLPRALKLLG